MRTKAAGRRKSTKRQPKKTRERYGAAARLLALQKLLTTPHGMTIEQVCEHFACGRHTTMRLIAALEAAGVAVTEERDGRRNIYRVALPREGVSLKLSTAHVLALTVARQLIEFLEGTTLKESFDEVVEQLEASLGKKAFASLGRLHRKVLVIDDAPYLPGDRSDNVDAVITALERGQRLSVRKKGARGERAFDIDPYTLVVFRKGLYVAGFSHRHKSVRLFGLDTLSDVEWKKGERAPYPSTWDPRVRYPSGFDLFEGPETRVRVRFDAKVAKFAARRQWHPSQRIEPYADGHVEVTLTVRGTTQIVSWVLGYGEHAEVLEPETLRDELAQVTKAMASRYGG